MLVQMHEKHIFTAFHYMVFCEPLRSETVITRHLSGRLNEINEVKQILAISIHFDQLRIS